MEGLLHVHYVAVVVLKAYLPCGGCTGMGSVQVWLVVADCTFISVAPVLVHASKDASGKFPYHPVSINLLVEVAKTLFAMCVLVAYVSP